MNAHRYLMCMLSVLVGSSLASAQKTPPKAPAAKPAAAAKAPAAGGAKGPSTASKGPTTASKGPTTSGAKGPTTAGGAHGPTTAGKGPSTAGGAHSPAAGGARPGAGGAARPGGARPTNAAAHGGREPAGSHTVHTANGSSVRTRANGQRADIHDSKRGMDVHHGLNGNRRVAVERRDHSRIVSERGGRGYVQHPYMYHGREFAHRTYYRDGRAYDRFYGRYPYHGVYLEAYSPSFYYRPAFYGWAYNPWIAPVPYAWGFVAAPWYGVYGAYFTPYPVYASASFWLADYMISQSLAANYAAAQAAAAGQQQAMAPDAAPLTPDVKNMIADEVKRQLALENSEAQATAATPTAAPDPASSGIARMLSDNQPHVFVAGVDLDLIDAGGTECAVSEGDALQLTTAPAADATAANLVMLSSKGGKECKKGASVSVALADLQDMQNHMRETIDAGMGDLQKGGKGLPAVPASAAAAPVKADFAAIAPPPDANAATEIQQQSAEADKAEQEVAGAAGADASGPSAAAAPAAAPAEISLGQTIDQVTAILGQPKSVVDLGAKKIYVYKDMKIVFNGGKVTDVQ